MEELHCEAFTAIQGLLLYSGFDTMWLPGQSCILFFWYLDDLVGGSEIYSMNVDGHVGLAGLCVLIAAHIALHCTKVVT